ncbi:MAG: hypothetical protein RLZZ283_194 [Candidatus Parcubacteria bacterium]|jgi:hypothetical protein
MIRERKLNRAPSLRVRALPELEDKPLEVVREEAKKYGRPATTKDLKWVLENQESETARRMHKEGGTYFFLGDKGSDSHSAAHIHDSNKGLMTHRHGLFGWRKGDRVVYVDSID